MATRILVVDNYDSFVYNLVQYLAQLDAECTVHRNDAVDLEARDDLLQPAVVDVDLPHRSGRLRNNGLQ